VQQRLLTVLNFTENIFGNFVVALVSDKFSAEVFEQDSSLLVFMHDSRTVEVAQMVPNSNS
jgi:hypothetical protein